MDVYPDVAVALGVLRQNSPITRALVALADASRHRADGLIALGPCMRERLATRGIRPERIDVCENWADGRLIKPLPWPKDEPFVTLYSGHFGLAHHFDTICHAMVHLKNDERFQFVFAGDGPRRSLVQSFCKSHGLENARFLPYCEEAQLSEHLGACHAGLVTQETATLGTAVPSKIYAIMAAGRPVIFVGPPGATPGQTIARFRCGWQVDPGDVDGLLKLLARLASCSEELRKSGTRGRAAFESHYDLPYGVNRICEILTRTSRYPGGQRRSDEESTDNRHHGPGWSLPDQVAAGKRL